MKLRLWGRLTVAALLVFLSRALFVPPALEDYDSVNFALALHDYDPLAHRPHPPGYPVYVAIARLVHVAFPDPAMTLGLLSALAQALCVFPAWALFRRLDRPRAAAACVLLFTCPVVWFNGARPLSDSVGLLFVLATQALLLGAVADGHGLGRGSALAGLAAGARLQSLALTLPLWLLAACRGRLPRALALLSLGVLAWLIPMFFLSGGVAPYLAAFHETMAMAIAIEPVHTRFNLNMAARAASYVLIRPWVSPLLGAAVLGLSLLGARHLWRTDRRGLWLALLCFFPYLVAHALYQQVEAVRYTLPYVPLASLLAAAGLAPLAAWTRRRQHALSELTLTIPLGLVAAFVTVPGLGVLATVTSPPEAAVDAALRLAEGPQARDGGRPGYVLAAHYTMERYLDRSPTSTERLPSGIDDSTPRLLEYWLAGGRRDVLFLADSERTDLASIDPRARRVLGHWRWPLDVERFMPGARPLSTKLVRIVPPAWVAGPGWLLSLEASRPEQAARASERLAYLRPLGEPEFLLLAGEPETEAPDCVLHLELAGVGLEPVSCAGSFHVGRTLQPEPSERYARLSVHPRPRADGSLPAVLLRGIDYASSRNTGFVHGSGWHAPESDERGRAFRWTSRLARSLVHVPEAGARLRVEGTAPLRYVGAGGRVRLLVDGEEVARQQVHQPWFELAARLPGGPQRFREIGIDVERVFRPDERQKNGDRRELGLRVYDFDVRAAPALTHPAP